MGNSLLILFCYQIYYYYTPYWIPCHKIDGFYKPTELFKFHDLKREVIHNNPVHQQEMAVLSVEQRL
jgi:hypothetical protein